MNNINNKPTGTNVVIAVFKAGLSGNLSSNRRGSKKMRTKTYVTIAQKAYVVKQTKFKTGTIMSTNRVSKISST